MPTSMVLNDKKPIRFGLTHKVNKQHFCLFTGLLLAMKVNSYFLIIVIVLSNCTIGKKQAIRHDQPQTEKEQLISELESIIKWYDDFRAPTISINITYNWYDTSDYDPRVNLEFAQILGEGLSFHLNENNKYKDDLFEAIPKISENLDCVLVPLLWTYGIYQINAWCSNTIAPENRDSVKSIIRKRAINNLYRVKNNIYDLIYSDNLKVSNLKYEELPSGLNLIVQEVLDDQKKLVLDSLGSNYYSKVKGVKLSNKMFNTTLWAKTSKSNIYLSPNLIRGAYLGFIEENYNNYDIIKRKYFG